MKQKRFAVEQIVAILKQAEAGVSPVEVQADGRSMRLLVPSRYVANLTNRHANRVSYES